MDIKNSSTSHVEETQVGVNDPQNLPDAEKAGGEITRDWTEEEEKALVRKVDLRLLPMLCLILGLSFLDRSNISSAYVAGLDKDLHLNIGGRYSLALLVFFLTYGLFEIPSNLVIRRIGARIWLSVLIICWGVMVLSMGFAKSWPVIIALRVLLGAFEAGLLPGAVFVISSWYRIFESARRISGFFMASVIANAFGGLLAFALSKISVGTGIYSQGWRWIFIVEGVATIVAGFAAFFLLGDFPERATWLTPRQQHIAVTRLAIERANKDYAHSSFKKSLSYILDVKLGIMAFMYFMLASSIYSVTYFTPVIISAGMGFDYSTTLLLTSPPWVFCVIMAIAAAFWSDKYKMRWPVLVFQGLNTIVGLLLLSQVKVTGVRLFGVFLATYGAQANVPSLLTFAQNNTANPSRQGIVSAVMITAGAVGGVCGSTIFRSQDAPTYGPGIWTTIAMQILFLTLVGAFVLYFKRQNKRADNGEIEMLEGVAGFRYTL